MNLGTTSILCASLGVLMMTLPANIQDTNQTAKGPEPVTSQKFAELSDQFMKASLALSPTLASSVGYHKHIDAKTGKTLWLDALLDDLSLESAAEQRAFFQQWRKRFRVKTLSTTLTPKAAANWKLIDDQIGLNLLEFDKIQSYRHNATVPVELIGNALFLPLTQEYAPKEVRLGHVLSRVGEIPRLLNQVKPYMSDVDAIFVQTAIEENDGNIDMIENTIAREIPPGSPLKAKYGQLAPSAIAALKDFSKWLQEDLGKRPSRLTWRLGKEFYDQKFKLVMGTELKPEQLLADAVGELKAVRAEMLQLALPMHGQMYPSHGDHAELTGRDRENLIIGEVLQKISDDHTKRRELMQTIQADLGVIERFIREKKIVTLGSRGNLKVIPTPIFMRGIFSVAGFHSAPALEPQAEAEYWVTPIDPKMTDEQAESKLREYNNSALKWLTIHEALPGHYVQAEHASNIQPERQRLLA